MSSGIQNVSQSPNESVEIVQEASEENAESLEAAYKCLSAYEEEWRRLVEGGLTGVRERALAGELRTSRFRSVGWLLLLGGLEAPSHWQENVVAARHLYSQLKASLVSTPSGLAPDLDNPLSQHDQSSWHQWFCDRELKGVIKQDVVRTFPGVDFFRDPEIQDSMVNILFCYARDNPNMCYRQGMHEVLAPLVFVLHCDHQALLHTKERGNVSPEICHMVNPDYLEEDSYTLFRRMMNAVEAFYRISDMAPTATGYFPPRTGGGTPENQVVSQLNWIKETLLSLNDPQLYHHLEKLDIPLPLFGIRWLRLMFGREFPLQDLLVLWDAIFAQGPSFDLVNYIVVAMLIAIRSSLLSSDYTACLTLLMRYPGSMDISYIIEYALHLKDPKNHRAPTMKAMPQLAMQEKFPNRRPPNNNHQNRKTNIINKSGNRILKSRLPLPATPQTEKAIVDGYAPDDPMLMLAELRNAYAMMSLVRLKLQQYHRALNDAVPQNNIPAQEALTGIHELCSLLEPRSSLEGRGGVEPAYEVGEATLVKPSSPTLQPPEEKPPLDMTIFKQTLIPINEPQE